MDSDSDSSERERCFACNVGLDESYVCSDCEDSYCYPCYLIYKYKFMDDEDGWICLYCHEN